MLMCELRLFTAWAKSLAGRSWLRQLSSDVFFDAIGAPQPDNELVKGSVRFRNGDINC